MHLHIAPFFCILLPLALSPPPPSNKRWFLASKLPDVAVVCLGTPTSTLIDRCTALLTRSLCLGPGDEFLCQIMRH